MRLALILIMATAICPQITFAQCIPGYSIFVEVPGTYEGWTETIPVVAGQYLHVSASGCICANYCHTDSLDMYGPDGRNCATGEFMDPDDPDLMCPYHYPLSLVARIGDGECFYAGSDTAFQAPESGMLSFCYNDRPNQSGFIDNVGHFDVCIDLPVATRPCSWGTLKSRFR
jgi:hypothetical protein